MRFWQSVKELSESVSRSSPEEKETMAEVYQETAKSHLRNQSRIENLMDLVQADDFEQLAFDDREKVRQYEDKKLLGRHSTPEPPSRVRRGVSKRKDDMETGHILGDVKIEQGPNKNPIAGVIVPLATMGLLGLIAWKLLDSQEPAPAPPPVAEQPAQPPIEDTPGRLGVGLGFGIPETVFQEET